VKYHPLRCQTIFPSFDQGCSGNAFGHIVSAEFRTGAEGDPPRGGWRNDETAPMTLPYLVLLQ
jgi:hypothetical protein